MFANVYSAFFCRFVCDKFFFTDVYRIDPAREFNDPFLDKMRLYLRQHYFDLRLFVLFFLFGEVDVFLHAQKKEQNFYGYDDGKIAYGVAFKDVL